MRARWQPEYLNAILAPVSILMMVGYNVCLYLRFKRNPMSTTMGVNHRARREWVRTIMADNDKKNVLAVQTLRNSIMGSTLLATTAILLSSAVAAFLASSYEVKRALHGPSFLGVQTAGDLTLTYLSLLMGFLFAFLCYVQSVRYTNHVNFIINIPAQGQFTPDYVADILEKASNFYTIGTRGFYMSIPLLLWLFGPVPFFVSTVILIPIWCWLDTAHDHHRLPGGDNCGPENPSSCHACEDSEIGNSHHIP